MKRQHHCPSRPKTPCSTHSETAGFVPSEPCQLTQKSRLSPTATPSSPCSTAYLACSISGIHNHGSKVQAIRAVRNVGVAGNGREHAWRLGAVQRVVEGGGFGKVVLVTTAITQIGESLPHCQTHTVTPPHLACLQVHTANPHGRGRVNIDTWVAGECTSHQRHSASKHIHAGGEQ